MSREEVSRKKLLEEPDEFLSRSQQVWLWVHENRDKAAMIAGGVVAVVLLTVGLKAYSERSHEQRSAAVAAAVARYAQASGGAAPVDLRQEFTALADRYAGSPEGVVARFFQAGSFAAAGEFDKARQSYATLTSLGGDQAEIALLARQATAYLDLAGGALDPALKSFQELLSSKGGAVARAQIMLEIAAIHEKQGRAAEARRVYQELIADHPEGSCAVAAKERLRVLAETPPSAS